MPTHSLCFPSETRWYLLCLSPLFDSVPQIWVTRKDIKCKLSWQMKYNDLIIAFNYLEVHFPISLSRDFIRMMQYLKSGRLWVFYNDWIIVFLLLTIANASGVTEPLLLRFLGHKLISKSIFIPPWEMSISLSIQRLFCEVQLIMSIGLN